MVYEPIPEFGYWAALPDLSDKHMGNRLSGLKKIRIDVGVEVQEAITQKFGREAAAESGALEGLYRLEPGQTRVIASQGFEWELALTEQGPDKLGLFESQLDAYQFVRSESRRSEFELTQVWIRDLHRRVCASQKTYDAHIILPDGSHAIVKRELRHGEYKGNSNETVKRDGQVLSFAAVEDVQPEISRLVDETRRGIFKAASPVVQAAYVHYCLTHIHPFDDGNGRTARALASFYTYRLCDLPVIVYADRRGTYIQALESANAGNFLNFVQHFQYRLMDTVSRANDEMREAVEVSVDEAFDELLSIKATDALITVADTQRLAVSLIEHIDSELTASLNKRNVHSEGVFIGKVSNSRPMVNMPYQADHKAVIGSWVSASMLKPAEVATSITYCVGIAINLRAMYTFRVLASFVDKDDKTAANMYLTYEDVFPELSTSAIERVRLFVDKVQRGLIKDLQLSTRAALRQAGLSDE